MLEIVLLHPTNVGRIGGNSYIWRVAAFTRIPDDAPMARRYRHVVIGAGALGSATAYRLARECGGDVLVVEQFRPGHDRGASEDHSRIIRHSYHSTDYTALTPDAYAAWRHVEEETGLSLVARTGGLDLTDDADSAGAAELAGYADALDAVGIGYQHLEAAAIRRRWPQWRVSDRAVALFQEDGGILDIRRANAAHLALARALGTTVVSDAQVRRIVDGPGGDVTVVTDAGEFVTGSLVVCAGSWTEPLLAPLGMRMPITLSQEQVGYFATPNLKDFSPDRFPIWIWHGEQHLYGFPVYGEAAVKVGRDMSGRFVTSETRSHVPDPAETERLAAFLRDRLPGAAGPELVSKTCVYDMPPDRNFILDRLPGHPAIVVGVGAGHAAKFAGLIGRILTDLAVRGETSYPIEAFRADRPALTEPDFPCTFRLTGAEPVH